MVSANTQGKTEVIKSITSYEEEEEDKDSSSWREITVTIAACLANWLSGIGTGFPTIALMSMKNDPDIDPSEEAASWIAALGSLGGVLGSLTSGPLMKIFGRKTALLCCTTVTSLLAFSLMILAKNLSPTIGKFNAVLVILVGRVFMGVASGAAMAIVPVFITETVKPHLRERLGPFTQLLRQASFMLALTFGSFMTWYTFSIVSVLSILPIGITQCILPESPVWLATIKKDFTSAEASLRTLRGENANIEKEMVALQQKSENINNLSQNTKNIHTGSSWKELWKPIAIALGVMAAVQFSGNAVFTAYRLQMFQEIDGTVNPYPWSIAMSGIHVITPIVAVIITKWFSSKSILVASSSALALSLFALAINIEAVDMGYKSFQWIPLLSITIFTTGFGIGLGSLAPITAASIIPSHGRDLGNAAAVTTTWMLAFISTKTFYSLKNLFEMKGFFYFYATLSSISVIFMAIFIPKSSISVKKKEDQRT